MNRSTVSAHITLSGDEFNKEYVTARLGVTPMYMRDKNEILGNGRKFGHTEWGIGTDTEESLDIELQFNKLYSLLQGKENILLQLSKDCNADWQIIFVIRIENGDVPSIVLSKQMLKFCYTIGAEVGFDIYVLSTRK